MKNSLNEALLLTKHAASLLREANAGADAVASMILIDLIGDLAKSNNRISMLISALEERGEK